jgi:PKD repeat protein
VKFTYQTEACTSGPVKVTFTNTTENASSYAFKWNFGKDLTSEKQNPAPVYFERGKNGNDTTYNISLEITGGTCGVNAPQLIPITVGGKALDVKFDADTTQGCNSLSVNFTNLSKGGVRYIWYFGDGDSCICAGPEVKHTYKAREKPYSVKLIAFTGSGCSDIYEIRDFIRVSLPPAPKFTAEPLKSSSYKYVFEDVTEGDIRTWQWDFGDSTAPVNSRNPLHSYLRAGDYNVTLTVTTYSGCTETVTNPLNVIIDTNKGSLFIPNAFMPNSEVEELRTFTAKGFGLSEWRMRIFNKWGETIWETTELNPDGSPAAGWDGKLQGLDVPQGVYFWEIKAKYKNGTVWPGISYNNSAPKHVGTINLIR